MVTELDEDIDSDDETFYSEARRRMNRFFDYSRLLSSCATGLSVTTNHPIIALFSAASWATLILTQRVYDRRGDDKSLSDYFTLTSVRDGLSLATGLTLGYGIDKDNGEVTSGNLFVSSLPAFTACVTHALSRKDLNELETSLDQAY